MSRVAQAAGLVAAVVSLISGLASPGYCQTDSCQPTTLLLNPGWTSIGSLNTKRFGHTATLLPNGKVLVAGGGGLICSDNKSDNNSCTAIDRSDNSAELYDPGSGTWSYTGSLNTARVYHKATLLQNGQVLVTGGAVGIYGSVFLNSAELYDPATGSWRPTGSFITIRSSRSATLLPNGKVLAVGASDPKKTNVVDSAELYDPDAGIWSSTGTPSLGGSTVLLSNGKVLAVCGTSAELYDPSTERWSSTGTLNRISIALTVTLLRNDKVLVTGESGSGSIAAELYDSSTGIWIITGGLHSTRSGESYTATLLEDGRVLVAGGYDSYHSVSGEEFYDPVTGTWSYTSRLIAARDYHTATLLQNGNVLVAAGVDGFYDIPIFRSSAELYDQATGPIPIPIPKIMSASAAGKKLFVLGENFDPGTVILLNGEQQITANDDQNPKTSLIGRKTGKKIRLGDKLLVRNPDGTVSEEFIFAGT